MSAQARGPVEPGSNDQTVPACGHRHGWVDDHLSAGGNATSLRKPLLGYSPRHLLPACPPAALALKLAEAY